MIEAAKFYEESAKHGYIKAIHAIGNAYYLGTGVIKSLDKAVAWLTVSAERGYRPSISLLKRINDKNS